MSFIPPRPTPAYEESQISIDWYFTGHTKAWLLPDLSLKQNLSDNTK